MPPLNYKARQEILYLIEEELSMVNAKANTVADIHWLRAEQEVARELGYDATLVRIEHVKNQISGLQKELADLEGSVIERARRATKGEYDSLDIRVSADHNGRVWNPPTVFGKEITTSWDVLVLKHLNERLPFFQIYTTLTQLHHAVRRELLLCGTFEEARALYQRFHERVTHAIGAEMPGLLSQIDSIPALKPPDIQ